MVVTSFPLLENLSITEFKNDEFKKEYLNKLSLVIQTIIKFTEKNLVSIYLLGSYGRGKGTVVLDMNNIRLVNDIDLAVVTIEKLESNVLQLLMDESTRIFNPQYNYVRTRSSVLDFHVDIFNFTYSEIPYLFATQFNIDFKYGSSLIYGENLFDKFPDYPNSDISLFDGLCLLSNRIFSLIEVISSDFLYHGDEHHQKEYVIYFSKKAIVDSFSALLILKGFYHSKFEDRLNYFEKLQVYDIFDKISKEEIQKVFRFYLIEHNVIDLSQDISSAINIWNQAKVIILSALNYYLNNLLGKNDNESLSHNIDLFYSNWDKLYRSSQIHYRKYRPLIKKYLGYARSIITRKYFHKKDIYSAGQHLLNAITIEKSLDTRIDVESIRHAIKFLERYDDLTINKLEIIIKPNFQTWETIKNHSVSIWKKLNWEGN